jgi:hypothetical protein
MSTNREESKNRVYRQAGSGEDAEKVSPSAPSAPTPKDPNLVEWNGLDDPENPQNFSPFKKWLITVFFSSMTMWVTFLVAFSALLSKLPRRNTTFPMR